MSHSFSTIKISFFMLLQLAGIYSTQNVSLGNEITKHVDKWVTSIFTIGGENGAQMVSGKYGSELNEFEYNISNQENNSHTKYIFQNISFRAPFSTEDGVIVQQINWNFSESKISTFFEGLEFCPITALVKTGVGNYEKSSEVHICATFKNFTSTVLRSYARDNDVKITHDFTYSAVNYRRDILLYPEGNLTRSAFNYNRRDILLYPEGNLTAEDKNQLHREIKLILPTILRKSLNNDQAFISKLDDLFQKYEKPRQEIISIHPNFMSNPLKHYYLIPKIDFFCFILKRIVIRGLSNFESYQSHGRLKYSYSSSEDEEPEIFTHTLLIRNIQGSMTLDYRSEKENDLELNFQIDHFILWKKDDTDCVYARARYYIITRKKTNTSLNSRQSEGIMDRLQSVLASGLLGLPSKEIDQICNVETPLDKIEISNCSDWKTIKESYRGWIPFHDDE